MIYLSNSTDQQEVLIPRSFGGGIPARRPYLTLDDIVNNLVTDDPDKVLSAAMGVELKRLIDNIDPESDIFWAEYGVTTFAEVTAAREADKVVVVGYDGGVYVLGRSDNSGCVFTSIEENVSKAVTIDETDSWSVATFTLEKTSNRVTEVNENSDNEHYATAKAVYDALPKDVLQYVEQTLTDAQKEQARQNIGATAPEVFWATYGTTTAAEIDAAVAAGKSVLCKHTFSANNTHIFIISQCDTSASTIYFTCTQESVVYYLTLTRSSNNWGYNRIFLSNGANKVDTIEGNETSTAKFPSTKAVADALGKMGVVSQTQTWANDYGSYTISNVVRGLIPQSFIDAWNHLVMSFGTFNETTGYFELNGLTDISYKEALVIKEKYPLAVQAEGWRPNSFSYSEMDIFSARTSIPIRIAGQIYPYLTWNTHIEVAKFSISDADYTGSFLGYGCYRLKKILDIIKNTSAINLPLFRALEECYFKIANNFSAPNSPFLSLQSIVYLVDNAFNGSNLITITLHADAYARCQADTTEYTYSGQTYTGIIAYAAAKNITIQSA